VADVGGSAPNGSAPDFGCETTSDRGRFIVTVRGEVDIATAPIVEAALCDAIASSRQPVVADLAAVEFIDSSGVHALLVANVAARDHRIPFVLRAPHAHVMRVLDLLGLTDQLAFEAGGAAGERV
jgi:anti-sigma B factor antagonist